MPFVITFLTRLARQDDVTVHHRSTSHPPHDHILFDQSPLARVIKRTPSNYLGICYSTILPSRRTKLDVSSWKLVLLGLLYRFSLFSSPGELFPTTCSSLIHPSYTHSCHGPFFLLPIYVLEPIGGDDSSLFTPTLMYWKRKMFFVFYKKMERRLPAMEFRGVN